MTTPARPGQFTGATDNAANGGLFTDTLIDGIPDVVGADVAAAQTAATDAAASAAAAATSETNAATSETNASTSETNASTSETNAAASAASAATSASTTAADAATATTKASEASTSATNAAASQTAAANSATSAASSATSATGSANTAATSATASSNSATAAATSATNAAASYDDFDDRYLGAKTTDPTVDNDGDALVDGALYFDTTNNVMKVYDLGNTSWVRTTPTTAQQTAINTVSSRDADIATVAARDTDIGTVAARDADIGTVATNDADISTVATDLSGTDTIGTVATNITNVNTVSGISANVTTVATNNTNINTVATNNTNITTVAGIDSDVTTVASISADVTAVANISQDIQDVQDEIANIQTLANDLNEVTSEIDTVANSIANVDLVGADIANVNTVATNLADVNSFADTYFISATAPTSPTEGDLWFDTANDIMKVYDGSGFVNAGSSVNGTAERQTYTATSGQTTFAATYDAGYIDVYLNGVKLIDGIDFTATSGSSVVLSSGAALNDTVDIVAYGTFNLLNIAINDLTDVNTSGISNGQVLAYNSTSSDFEPTTITSDLVDDTTPQLGGNLDVNGNSIVSASNGDINLTPNGTGNVLLGNYEFDVDQTVGAGQDDYVLTYDNATGHISLEAAGAGGAGYFQGENGVTGDATNGKGDIFRVHEQELNTNTTIAAGDNAGAFFSLTVATGVTLTVNGNLVIA